MKFLNGEIIITPRIIYWVGLPASLTHDDMVDVLKNDILIIPFDSHFSSFYQLTKTIHQRTVYFYNLDAIIKENSIGRKHITSMALSLSDFILHNYPLYSIVYSNKAHDAMSHVFKKHNILYYSSCFSSKKTLPDSIIHMTNILFAKNEKSHKGVQALRSSFRLFLLPLKYTIELAIPDKKDKKICSGYIIDISLNGIGCVLDNPDLIRHLQLKNELQIKLFLHNTIIRINSCYVSRVHPGNGEIGVSYDINDSKVISETHGDILSSLMYTWLKHVMRQYEEKRNS